MFGKKKSTPVTTSVLTDNPEEPVHVFDQTNGVLKKFESQNTPADDTRDYQDGGRAAVGIAGNQPM